LVNLIDIWLERGVKSASLWTKFLTPIGQCLGEFLMSSPKIMRGVFGTSAVVASALVCSAFGRDFGVDVSHYQGAGGNTSVSQSAYSQMYTEGKRFVFIKATEGLTGPDDATMAGNVANASAAGLLTGVYHFAHPENRPTTAGAIQEADHFVTYAGSAIGPGHLRPVIDLERGTGLGSTALTDWVIAFCNEVMAQDGPAAAPIVYTDYTSFLDTRMSSYDLWLLDQINPSDPNTANPSAAAIGNFSNWSFWQYGVGSAGGVSPIDLDVVNSDYKFLSSFVISVPEPATSTLAMIFGALLLRRRGRRTRGR
jgi:GH25 family lysozyme M1 (1,4-beta-N-acetylmuramidase)